MHRGSEVRGRQLCLRCRESRLGVGRTLFRLCSIFSFVVSVAQDEGDVRGKMDCQAAFVSFDGALENVRLYTIVCLIVP